MQALLKENLERLKEHVLLIPVFFISIFGFSYQAIPVLSWFFIPLILSYTRYQSKWRLVFLYITTQWGFFISYLGSFRVTTDGPKYPLLNYIFAFGCMVSVVIGLAVSADQFVISHSTHPTLRVCFFPALWTSIWFVFYMVGGYGDYLSLTVSLVNWPAFAQTADLAGRPLLDFLMALFGTSLLELPTFPTDALLPDTVDLEAGLRPIERLSKLWKHPWTKFSVLVLALLVYGDARVNIRSGSFFQTSYSDFVPDNVPVGCVVGPGSEYLLQADHQRWFEKSNALTEAGAKLVLWSEITASVNNTEDEAEFLQKAKEFASSRQVYLAVTYVRNEPIVVNKMVLITKEGEIGIDYNKAHPAPGETQPPGPHVLQYVDTEEFGRIGAGICFDFNFGRFISQASQHKIDLMLQPSWTWGPIGTHHAQTNILRSVENGFTLFRCVSQGVSGIFEPTLDGLYNQKVPSINKQHYLFYLPLQKRIPTVFGYVGNSFAYVCIFVSFLASVFLVYTRKKNPIAI